MRNVNSDVAYDYIRKRILNGEYAPGYALTTEKLSSETGVSRTPVREALHRLAADGLIVILPQLGASVKRLDLNEFRELCELRRALEGNAALLAATNHNKPQLREMGYALEEMEALTNEFMAAKTDDEPAILERAGRADVKFHLTIISAASNELMKREIIRLHLVSRVHSTSALSTEPSRPGKNERNARRQEVQQQHREIFEAIAARDHLEARAAMERHIQQIIDMSLSTLKQRMPAPIVEREATPEESIYTP